MENSNISSLHINVPAEDCFAKSEAYDEFRYALVVYVGTPIAVLGILSNAVLIRLFCNRKRLKSPTFYLFALAIFDALICAIYLPFFTVDAVSIYYGQAKLYKLWHSYAMVLYGTSRMVQFASTYMVVCATLERFIAAADLRCMAYVGSTTGRFSTVGLTLFTVFGLRLPAFFDYQIVHNEKCPDFQDFSFLPLLMARDNYIQFNFYVISFLHILLPFLLLLALNVLIIFMTKKKIYHHKFLPPGYNFVDVPKLAVLLRKESVYSNRRHRSELRYATRTMVMITFTYLFCNLFNVLITVMEHIFKQNSLMFNKDGSSTKFYTYTADLISIMVTVNSFARIFVYFFCNPQFRYQLIRVANNWMKCGERIISGLRDWRQLLHCAGRAKLSIQQNRQLPTGTEGSQFTDVANNFNNTISSSKSTLYL